MILYAYKKISLIYYTVCTPKHFFCVIMPPNGKGVIYFEADIKTKKIR
nr:MAG TPA: hypothetical protein [Caudoviricetes sp.]